MSNTTTTTRALVIGDQHFKITNMIEIDIYITNLIKYATSIKPKFIVMLGDLLDTHERLNTFPLNKAVDLLNKLRKIAPTYCLVGNHDMTSNKQFLNTNNWMSHLSYMKNITIVDKVIVEKIDDKTFIFVPYVYNGRFIEALNTSKYDYIKDPVCCIFAHQEFKGCKMGSFISEDGDEWPLDYPKVISGHIHINQTPQTNIYYPGSSMQTSYEDDLVIIADIEFNEDYYVKKEVDLELPSKRIVYVKMDNINNWVVPDDISINKVKVIIHDGSFDEFKAFKKTTKYKKLIGHINIQLIFKHKANEKIVIDKFLNNIINDDTISKDFKTILNRIIVDTNDDNLTKCYDKVFK